MVYLPTPLKNDGVSNSWDDESHWNPIYFGKKNVPNHQPGIVKGGYKPTYR